MILRNSPVVKIGSVEVSSFSRPKIIAEAGVAHYGSFEKLQKLVDLAVNANADFFKMQHFHTSTLINSIDLEWSNRMRSKEVDDSFIKDAKGYCDEKNIPFLCTGHDERSLEFLLNEDLIAAVKIGSGERENFRMFDLALSSDLPLIISLGMYTDQHIEKLHNYLRSKSVGADKVILMHCVTAYPVSPSKTNIRFVRRLAEEYPYLVGYSDHTKGIAFPLASVTFGAVLIEKHIANEFNVPNAQDWKVSSDEAELKMLCAASSDLFLGLSGEVKKGSGTDEVESQTWALKSPYYSGDLALGSTLTDNDVLMQRPFTGYTFSDLELLIGRTLKRHVKKGSALSKTDF